MKPGYTRFSPPDDVALDCTSFILMRRLGLNNVFAFDPHFKQQGFEVLWKLKQASRSSQT